MNWTTYFVCFVFVFCLINLAFLGVVAWQYWSDPETLLIVLGKPRHVTLIGRGFY